ncbi:hypothetical protein OH77DRAFT_1425103 [Trametes cingulata]|nr:hypothetical protein OH77DRAFT_1425103 [Trametes cingulata]
MDARTQIGAPLSPQTPPSVRSLLPQRIPPSRKRAGAMPNVTASLPRCCRHTHVPSLSQPIPSPIPTGTRGWPVPNCSTFDVLLRAAQSPL